MKAQNRHASFRKRFVNLGECIERFLMILQIFKYKSRGNKINLTGLYINGQVFR